LAGVDELVISLAAKGLTTGQIAAASSSVSPFVVKGLECRLGGVGVDGCVDRLQIASDLLARHVLEAVP